MAFRISSAPSLVPRRLHHSSHLSRSHVGMRKADTRNQKHKGDQSENGRVFGRIWVRACPEKEPFLTVNGSRACPTCSARKGLGACPKMDVHPAIRASVSHFVSFPACFTGSPGPGFLIRQQASLRSAMATVIQLQILLSFNCCHCTTTPEIDLFIL